MLQAFGAAIERADLVQVEVVDILENPDLAEKYGAFSVPQTVYDDKLTTPGLESQEAFTEELLSLQEAKEVVAPEPGEDVECDGGGPHRLPRSGAGPPAATALLS